MERMKKGTSGSVSVYSVEHSRCQNGNPGLGDERRRLRVRRREGRDAFAQDETLGISGVPCGRQTQVQRMRVLITGGAGFLGSHLCDALLALSRARESFPTNIGNPSEFTILECAQLVLQATGSTSIIRFELLPQDDPKQRRPDSRRRERCWGGNPRSICEPGWNCRSSIFELRLAPKTRARTLRQAPGRLWGTLSVIPLRCTNNSGDSGRTAQFFRNAKPLRHGRSRRPRRTAPRNRVVTAHHAAHTAA